MIATLANTTQFHDRLPTKISGRMTICIKCAGSFEEEDYEMHEVYCRGSKQPKQFIYYRCPSKNSCDMSHLMEVDRFDLPLTRPFVELNGISVGDSESVQIETKRKSTKSAQVCCFCQNVINRGDKMNLLPCQHPIHFSCVKKWLIIVEPCQTCLIEPGCHKEECCSTSTASQPN